MASGNISSNIGIGSGGGGGIETVTSKSEFPSSPGDGDEIILEKSGRRILYIFDASLGNDGTWRPRGFRAELSYHDGAVDSFDPRTLTDQGEITAQSVSPHFIGIKDYRGSVPDGDYVSYSIPSVAERGMEHSDSDLATQSLGNGPFVDPGPQAEHVEVGASTISALFRPVSMNPKDHSYGKTTILRLGGDDASGSANAIVTSIGAQTNGPRNEIRLICEDDALDNQIARWDWPFCFRDGHIYLFSMTVDGNDIFRCYVNGHKLNRITSITNGSDAGSGNFSPNSRTTDGSNARLKVRAEPSHAVTYLGRLWGTQQTRSDLRTYRDNLVPSKPDETDLVRDITTVMSNNSTTNDLARLYPDTSNADGLTDQTGQTSGFESTGTTANIFNAKELAGVNQTRWDSTRTAYITPGTITHRILLVYTEDSSPVAFTDANPEVGDNNLYQLRLSSADDGTGNFEINYFHQHGSTVREDAFYKISRPSFGTVHLITMSKLDNGDGTTSTRLYWDGNVVPVDSISSDSGDAFTEDSGNTFTAPIAENNSTYHVGLGGTRGGPGNLKSYIGGYWIEDQYTTDSRETDIAGDIGV